MTTESLGQSVPCYNSGATADTGNDMASAVLPSGKALRGIITLGAVAWRALRYCLQQFHMLLCLFRSLVF